MPKQRVNRKVQNAWFGVSKWIENTRQRFCIHLLSDSQRKLERSHWRAEKAPDPKPCKQPDTSEDVTRELEPCSELRHLRQGRLNCEPADLVAQPLRLLKGLPSSPERATGKSALTWAGDTRLLGPRRQKWLQSAIGEHHSLAERRISKRHRKHYAHHGAAMC